MNAYFHASQRQTLDIVTCWVMLCMYVSWHSDQFCFDLFSCCWSYWRSHLLCCVLLECPNGFKCCLWGAWKCCWVSCLNESRGLAFDQKHGRMYFYIASSWDIFHLFFLFLSSSPMRRVLKCAFVCEIVWSSCDDPVQLRGCENPVT